MNKIVTQLCQQARQSCKHYTSFGLRRCRAHVRTRVHVRVRQIHLDHYVVTVDCLLSLVHPTLHHITVLFCQQLPTSYHHHHNHSCTHLVTQFPTSLRKTTYLEFTVDDSPKTVRVISSLFTQLAQHIGCMRVT